MTTDPYSTIISTLTTSAYNDVKGLLKKELTTLFNKSLEKYLENELIFNSKMKTILFKNDDISFTKYYTKPRIQLSGSDKPNVSSSALDIYNTAKHIMLVGEAGIGKSSFVKYLVNDCLYSKTFIPVLIELRTLEKLDRENIRKPENIIRDKIFEAAPEISSDIIEKNMQANKIAVFLDGFDEIKNENLENIKVFISTLLKRYPNSFIVLTSRPHANAEYIGSFKSCSIRPFNDLEIMTFIRNISDLYPREFISNLTNEIEKSKKLPFYMLLSNPLFLTLFITTFTHNANIPKDLAQFYEHVMEALFSLHDTVSKYSFKRETKCKLPRQEIEKNLKSFSFLSFMDNQISFKRDQVIDYFQKLEKIRTKSIQFEVDEFIDDMLITYSLWIKEDISTYRFTHRSFQEFFFCSYVHSLSPDKKNTFYQKFIERIDKKNKIHELQHLLKLLSGIDSIDFITNFSNKLIPNIISDLQGFSKSKTGVAEYILQYHGHKELISSGKDEFGKITSITFNINGKSKFLNQSLLIFILNKHSSDNIDPFAVELIFSYFNSNKISKLDLTSESDANSFSSFYQNNKGFPPFNKAIEILKKELEENSKILSNKESFDDLINLL